MNQTVPSPSFEALHVPRAVPFYYSQQHALVDGIADRYLALGAPILAYWSLSLLFHYLDMSDWKWLEKYRIHDSAEVKSRNLATRTQVVRAVLFQQLVQTLLGLVWLSEESEAVPDHVRKTQNVARWIVPLLNRVVGEKWGAMIIGDLAYFVYWWCIPTLQLFFAMCVPFSCPNCSSHSYSFTGFSLTHGSTFYTDGCMSTNSCTSIFILGTIAYTCHMHLAHYTTTPWRDWS